MTFGMFSTYYPVAFSDTDKLYLKTDIEIKRQAHSVYYSKLNTFD
jgi:hypothetical protein